MQEIIQRHKMKQEEEYAGNLLAYAMGAAGDYTTKDGVPSFTPGGQMPSKTEAWNSYLQMKGGQVNAQDLLAFNQMYANAQQMQVSNQINELSKLQLQGVEPDEIQDLVKDNDQMYNNLLDMVSNLEGSGDEQAFQQAQVLRNYLPQEESKGLIGEAFEDELSLGEIAGLTGAGALAYGAYNWARDRGDLTDYKKEYKKQISAERKKLNTAQAKLNDMVQKRANMLNRKVNISPSAQVAMNKTIQKQQLKVLNARQNMRNINIKSQAPDFRYKALTKHLPKGTMGRGILGTAAYLAAEPMGRALGGETGAQLGRGGANLALLGQALRMAGPALMGKGPLGTVAGGALTALGMGGTALWDLYNQAT